jgi:2-polyprenyl-6-methoxyphenol hydroxylase-like FAD-dependent oxidoreductase
MLYTETLSGQIIGEMPSNSMSPGANAALTARDFRLTAQDQIDSMLLRHAKTYPTAQIRFNQELVEFEQDIEGTTITVEEKPSGKRHQIRSEFLVAADGGNSTARELAGIRSVGAFNQGSYVNALFRADLSRWTQGREAALIWTLAPGVEGAFNALDGKQRWACQIQLSAGQDPREDWPPERVTARIRNMIGPEAGELPVEVYSSCTYTVSSLVAERLREGRLLLVGDAAHKIPPFGSIGMNTGVQTAHNLVWKLAMVVSGTAPPTLLDTFDRERREVAHRVCTFGRVNAGYVAAIQSAKTAEAKRAAVAASASFGNWVGLDLGVHYECAGAFASDGSAPPADADAVTDYKPTARPGYRAPHFWIRKGADRFSSVDLFEHGFVLLTGEKGDDWIAASRWIAAQGRLRLSGYRVGPAGDLVPESASFTALYGIEHSGAVLVRPDGHVAFRSPVQTANAETTLREALRMTLGADV